MSRSVAELTTCPAHLLLEPATRRLAHPISNVVSRLRVRRMATRRSCTPSGCFARTIPSASRSRSVRWSSRSRRTVGRSEGTGRVSRRDRPRTTDAAGSGFRWSPRSRHDDDAARSASLRRMQNSLPSGSASITQPMPATVVVALVVDLGRADGHDPPRPPRPGYRAGPQVEVQPVLDLLTSGTWMNSRPWPVSGDRIMHSSCPGSLGSPGTSTYPSTCFHHSESS